MGNSMNSDNNCNQKEENELLKKGNRAIIDDENYENKKKREPGE